jgi:hypothetical protein
MEYEKEANGEILHVRENIVLKCLKPEYSQDFFSVIKENMDYLDEWNDWEHI